MEEYDERRVVGVEGNHGSINKVSQSSRRSSKLRTKGRVIASLGFVGNVTEHNVNSSEDICVFEN